MLFEDPKILDFSLIAKPPVLQPPLEKGAGGDELKKADFFIQRSLLNHKINDECRLFCDPDRNRTCTVRTGI